MFDNWHVVPGMTEHHRRLFIAKFHAEQADECWLWLAVRSSDGYGHVTIAGKTLSSHRIAWAMENGYWPTRWEFVCHSCDTPPCVNPGHLFLGTARDNAADRDAKGNLRYGVVTLFQPKEVCHRGHDLTIPGARVTRRNGRSGDCKECSNTLRRERRALQRASA